MIALAKFLWKYVDCMPMSICGHLLSFWAVVYVPFIDFALGWYGDEVNWINHFVIP